MAAPTFGGVAIFGTAVMMQTISDNMETQFNSFFGVPGVESIGSGTRGRMTHVSGLLYGDGSTFPSALSTFRSFRDENLYQLVDMLGQTWDSVELVGFLPQGRVMLNSAIGLFYQPYSAQFFHHL